jgi:apolipoprotein N-acyltransferase
MAERTDKIRFFLYALLAMFIWNAGTTWWIWNSTAAGAIGAIIANSFLMAIPLWGFYTLQSKLGARIGLLSFVVFWLTFEYIHLNWQLSWPWLTLGNVFAVYPNWVQWYEYTGTGGGSLWVLLVNVLFFITGKQLFGPSAHSNPQVHKSFGFKRFTYPAITAAALLLPIVVSLFVLQQAKNSSSAAIQNSKSNIVIVQPNIDPYNEKFIAGNTDAIIQKMIMQSEAEVDKNTRLVIWPETALPVPVWQNQVEQSLIYQPVFQFIQRHPTLTLITGIETYKNYGPEKATKSARKIEADGTYYDAFNAAVSLHANAPLQFYNKSKLVPGVETLPDFLLWLAAIFEHFGGTTGGYGQDKEAAVFASADNPYIAAPIICYESIYGEYIASYVRKGANLLTIITNDGWWANTPGHRQHLNYARLHAIETRRYIARSANTGISAVIDDKGSVLETRGWDKAGTIKYTIPALTGETFFVLHGDVLSPIAILLAILLFAWNLWLFIVSKTNKRSARSNGLKNIQNKVQAPNNKL